MNDAVRSEVGPPESVNPQPQPQSGGGGNAEVVERNIQALLARREECNRTLPRQERIAHRVTRFTGSLPSVYIHAAIFGLWTVLNLGWTPIKPFDPTLVQLATLASVEAMFLSMLVLMTQNRMQEEADRRADLDLQISLLSEHQITRLVTLTTAIAGCLKLDCARAPELQELAKDVKPEEVMDLIEKNEQEEAERKEET